MRASEQTGGSDARETVGSRDERRKRLASARWLGRQVFPHLIAAATSRQLRLRRVMPDRSHHGAKILKGYGTCEGNTEAVISHPSPACASPPLPPFRC